MVRQARQLPYLNFQISQPYLNQEGQITPTHWICLTKKFPWLRPCIWLTTYDRKPETKHTSQSYSSHDSQNTITI